LKSGIHTFNKNHLSQARFKLPTVGPPGVHPNTHADQPVMCRIGVIVVIKFESKFNKILIDFVFDSPKKQFNR
jgi:hypothetical protein